MDAVNSLVSSLSTRGYKTSQTHTWLTHLHPKPPPADVIDVRHHLYLPLTYNTTNTRLAKEIKDIVTTSLPDVKVVTAWTANRNLRAILR